MYLNCIKCDKKNIDLGHKHYEHYSTLQCNYDIKGKFPAGNSFSSFLNLFPVSRLHLNTGVGFTPLLKYASNVYVKDEGKNPTGSFKDRDTYLLVHKALELGYDSVHIVSSGNAAISTAFYSGIAGLGATCFIPKNTSKKKKEILYKLGSTLYEMPGSYEDIFAKVAGMDIPSWNLTPGINPFAGEGYKTIAYELLSQMGVPDKILVPCGNGTNLAFIWKGFKELFDYGKIKKLPRMIGVQVKGANPLSVAFREKKDFAVVPDAIDSIAEGIVASESYSSPLSIKALVESQGAMIDVEEAEIVSAYEHHLGTKFESEPTSATVFAALEKLVLEPGEKIALIMTGSNNKKVA